jgi:O-antigen/teichoic acid export membrane protein
MPLSSSPGNSLTIRTSWLVAAKTVAFALTVAIPLLLVRRMPQHEFGLYKQVFLIVNSAVTMLPLGFGMTAFYFLPREEDPRRRNQTVFNVVLFTAAVSSLFAAVLSLFPAILMLLFTEPAVVEVAPWIGLIIVLWVVGSFLEIVTIANQDIGVATAAILAIQVSRATFFLTAALVAGSVRALVFAAVGQGVLQVCLLVLYLRSRFPGFWTACDLSFLRRQLAYSLPFGAAGLMYSLQTDLHNYFVSHKFGAAIYAVYAIGCFQLPFFAILAESVGSVMIPRVSLLQHQQRTREIVLLTTGAMRKLAAVYFPAYAFLMIMRYEFITALFTARYIASVPVFAVNLTLIPLGILMTDPIMRAYAEHRHFAVKLHATLLVCLALGLSMSIGRFGLVGAITLVVVCHAIGRAAMVVKAIRILDVRPSDIRLLADIAKIAGAAATASVVAIGARSLMSGLPALISLFGCAACFGLVYLVATLLSGVVTPEERELVLGHLSHATGRWQPRAVQAASLARD